MIVFVLVTSYFALLVPLRSVVLTAQGGGDQPARRGRLVPRAGHRLSVGLAALDRLRLARGHIDTIVLVLVLAVTFGLSMDYEASC